MSEDMFNIHLQIACVIFQYFLPQPIAEDIPKEGNKMVDVACDNSPWRSFGDSNSKWITTKNVSMSLYEAVYDFLALLNETHAVFIIPDESDVKRVRCLSSNGIKVLTLQNLSSNIKEFVSINSPHYVLFGNSYYTLQSLLRKAHELKLTTGDSRWTIAVKDNWSFATPYDIPSLFVLQIHDLIGCYDFGMCVCTGPYNDCRIKLDDIYSKWLSELSAEPIDYLNDIIKARGYSLVVKNHELALDVEIRVTARSFGDKYSVLLWSPSMKFKPINFDPVKILRRKLRIGMICDPPFLIISKEKESERYLGFSMDVLYQLQSLMNFEYELIIPASGHYGSRSEDGSWSGLIALLVASDIDLALAPISVTAETADAVEFVKPSFDSRGFSIVGRKREYVASLFKFTKVLKLEVWLGILASIVTVGIILWFNEKFCIKQGDNSIRVRLEDWLWCAFISFTPQGGGNVPNTWCGKVLVACYWLFVLLVTSAFVSNLTALLTVERMYRQVNSLEEMIRESGFSYTAVINSSAFEYFVTMAKAEEQIFSFWKTQDNFINWEYLVNERFKSILAAIEQTGTVNSLEEGIQRVKANKQGTFAIFTNSFTARYLVNNDCDLELIGKSFAEHPYEFAVARGSNLVKELTESMMKLQKERFFEEAMGSYMKKKPCPTSQSGGIRLYELGGVFILALAGLLMAVVGLIMEILVLKKKRKRKKNCKTTKILFARVVSKRRITHVRRF